MNSESIWNYAIQFGAVGVICLAFGIFLYRLVTQQNKERTEANAKVVALLEGTLRECTKVITENTVVQRENAQAKIELSKAIAGLPCHEWRNGTLVSTPRLVK